MLATNRLRSLLPLLAILLVALTLRAPLTSLPPVIAYVSDTLRITPTQAGLLTSIPVAFVAGLTPVASVLIGRAGIARSVAGALGLLLLGQLVRASGSYGLALVGTAFIGIGIAIGNVAIPLLIARDYASRAAAFTGGYSAAMNVGSALATILTVPMANSVGWQAATALWSLLAVFALIAWQLVGDGRATNRRRAVARASVHRAVARASVHRATPPDKSPICPSTASSAHSATRTPVLGREFAILTALLAVVFIGQSSSYYAVTAWLPEILANRLGVATLAAGGLAMPFQLLGAVGALLVPILTARGLPLRLIALIFVVCWLTLPLGMLLAPQFALLWACLAGAAQGGNFTILLTLIASQAPSIDAARRSSTIMQTTGYTASAIAPTLIGALSTATGGWTVPLLVISASLTIMGVTMLVATTISRRN